MKTEKETLGRLKVETVCEKKNGERGGGGLEHNAITKSLTPEVRRANSVFRIFQLLC